MSDPQTPQEPASPEQEPAKRKTPAMSQYLAPPKITARKLASDNLPVEETKAEEPKRKADPSVQLKRRYRYYRDIALGFGIIGALVFLLLPKEAVNRDDEIILQPEFAPDTTLPRTPVYTTPKEWVAKVRIGGVLATRIAIEGKAYSINQPIPPHGIKWIGREADTLIFQTADGTEYQRELRK